MNANKRARLEPAALRLVASAFVLAAAALPSTARAGDAAAAEALFNEARRLMSQGNFAAACPQLEESQRQDPGMGTLYNLADCYEKTGKVASAWAAFLDVAAQAKAAGQGPREADARSRAAALEPKLSRLTLAVEGPAATTEGLTIKRGSVTIGRAQWGLALPVDPGEHTLEISAPGKKTLTHKMQIAPNGASVRYAVPALEEAPAASPSAPVDPNAARATPAAAGDVETDRGPNQRTIGLVVGGVGVVGIGLGAFFGLRSMSLKGDGDAECKPNNDNCTAKGVEARDDALTAGTMSTVFFVAGAAIAAGGAVLYLTAPKSRTLGTSVVPVATAGGGALLLRGSFQ